MQPAGGSYGGSSNEVLRNGSSGVVVVLRYTIKLNIREEEVIKGLVNYFIALKNLTFMPTTLFHHPTSYSRPSYIYKSEKYKYISFMITKFSYINYIIIPFFDKYPSSGL